MLNLRAAAQKSWSSRGGAVEASKEHFLSRCSFQRVHLEQRWQHDEVEAHTQWTKKSKCWTMIETSEEENSIKCCSCPAFTHRNAGQDAGRSPYNQSSSFEASKRCRTSGHRPGFPSPCQIQREITDENPIHRPERVKRAAALLTFFGFQRLQIAYVALI